MNRYDGVIKRRTVQTPLALELFLDKNFAAGRIVRPPLCNDTTMER